MLRWMAPFLSFTAEEAWAVFGTTPSVFTETFWAFDAPDETLLAKWARLREIRDQANKAIEELRMAGEVGSSLQAQVTITAGGRDMAWLASLGDDLKYVFITSAARLVEGDALAVEVSPASGTKCERCWHWRDDIGGDPAHPAICGRCVGNLETAGERRRAA
jgi:isoleucyl-tRNA synthetase